MVGVGVGASAVGADTPTIAFTLSETSSLPRNQGVLETARVSGKMNLCCTSLKVPLLLLLKLPVCLLLLLTHNK